MLKIENRLKKQIAEIINILLFLFLFPFILKKSSFPKKIKKILIIRLDHIGDVIMSTPVYREIKKKYPKSKIYAMVGKWGEEILTSNPYIDELIIHNCPWWQKVRGEKANYLFWLFRELPQVIKKIRNEKFDVGIDLRGDFRHILFFLFLPRVKYKISYSRSGGTYLLDKPVKFYINQHEIEKNFRLLEEIGIKVEEKESKRPQIFLKDNEREKIEKILVSYGITRNKIKIVIHPFANNPLRTWKISNYIEVIYWLILKYEPAIFIVGGKMEKLEKEIENNLKNLVINLIGKLNLKETSALIEKCDFFIGNDSSIAHIASSFKIPSLILFGPTSPDRCLPYSEFTFFIYKKFSCSPCLQKKCIITKSKIIGKCMESISVGEVKMKIEAIFKRGLSHYSFI